MLHLGRTRFLTHVPCTASIPGLAVCALHNTHGHNIWPKTMPWGKCFHSVNPSDCSSGHHHFKFEVQEKKAGMQPGKGQISCFKLKTLRLHSLDPFGPKIFNWQSQSTWASWARTENTEFLMGWEAAAALFSWLVTARQLVYKVRFCFPVSAPEQSAVPTCPALPWHLACSDGNKAALLVPTPFPTAPTESHCQEEWVRKWWVLGGNYSMVRTQCRQAQRQCWHNTGAIWIKSSTGEQIERASSVSSWAEIFSLNTEFHLQITIAIYWNRLVRF